MVLGREDVDPIGLQDFFRVPQALPEQGAPVLVPGRGGGVALLAGACDQGDMAYPLEQL